MLSDHFLISVMLALSKQFLISVMQFLISVMQTISKQLLISAMQVNLFCLRFVVSSNRLVSAIFNDADANSAKYPSLLHELCQSDLISNLQLHTVALVCKISHLLLPIPSLHPARLGDIGNLPHRHLCSTLCSGSTISSQYSPSRFHSLSAGT